MDSPTTANRTLPAALTPLAVLAMALAPCLIRANAHEDPQTGPLIDQITSCIAELEASQSQQQPSPWPVDLQPSLAAVQSDPDGAVETANVPDEAALGRSASSQPSRHNEILEELANPNVATWPPNDDSWHVEFTPYLWAANVKAKVNLHGLKQNIHISFQDIRRNYKLTGMATLEFYKKHWVILVDGMYLNTIDYKQMYISDLQMDIMDAFLTVAGGLRWEKPLPFLIYAGARFNWASSRASIEGISFNLYHDKEWADPLVGARLAIPIHRKWSVEGLADLGGYGLEANYTWQMTGVLVWQCLRNASLRLGYRVMDTDVNTGAIELRTFNYGPMIGFAIRF
jgi:hypothetical protein